MPARLKCVQRQVEGLANGPALVSRAHVRLLDRDAVVGVLELIAHVAQDARVLPLTARHGLTAEDL